MGYFERTNLEVNILTQINIFIKYRQQKNLYKKFPGKGLAFLYKIFKLISDIMQQ